MRNERFTRRWLLTTVIVGLMVTAAAGVAIVRLVSMAEPPTKAESAAINLASCSEGGPDLASEDCLAERLVNQYEKGGLERVLSALESENEAEYVQAQCHDPMHEIGRRLVRDSDAEGIRAVLLRDSETNCTIGLVHGIVMQASSQPNGLTASEIIELCRSHENPATRQGCLHGTGHLARRGEADEKPAGVQQSLQRCTRLLGRYDVDCAPGVFHDVWLGQLQRDSAPDVTANDELGPKLCDSVAPRFAMACWWRLSETQLVGIEDSQLVSVEARVDDFCSARQGKSGRACRMAVFRTLLGSPEETLQACATVSERNRVPCIDALWGLSEVFDLGSLDICGMAEQPIERVCALRGLRVISSASDVAPLERECRQHAPRSSCRSVSAQAREPLGLY